MKKFENLQVKERVGTDDWVTQPVEAYIPCAFDLAVRQAAVWWLISDQPDEIPQIISPEGIVSAENGCEPALAVGADKTLVAVWQTRDPSIFVDEVQLYQATFPASTIKRYSAGGQQVALKVDDQLYYTLTDPTGASLLFTDASGAAAGHILYDPYGGVLTSTLSAALTAALAEQGATADPDTGLVYQGSGRFYDPVLGRPLQPNPLSGVPTLPQSLNRYGATALGAPGVAEGLGSEDSFLTGLAWNAVSNAPGAVVGDLGRVTIQPVLKGSKTAVLKAIRHAEVREALGAQAVKEIQALRPKKLADLGYKRGYEFSFTGAGRLVRADEAEGLLPSTFDKATLEWTQSNSGWRGFLAANDLSVGVGIDVAVATLFEVNAPYWSNPYLSPGQKVGQFGSNLFFAGTASIATFYTVAAIGVTGPVGVVVTIGVATFYGLAFGQVSQAFIEFIGANQENRRLQPLGGVP